MTLGPCFIHPRVARLRWLAIKRGFIQHLSTYLDDGEVPYAAVFTMRGYLSGQHEITSR